MLKKEDDTCRFVVHFVITFVLIRRSQNHKGGRGCWRSGPRRVENDGALHYRILLIIKLSVTYQQHTFQIKFKQKGKRDHLGLN